MNRTSFLITVRKRMRITVVLFLLLLGLLTFVLPANASGTAVAAGRSHTVGLKTDGTVLAVGDNFYGQCNVGSWTDIQQVSAFWSHTVGLKTDGSVVAMGLNDYGQCNLSSWTGIQQIVAAACHTVGLKTDGTVVAVGLNDYGQCNVDSWTGIQQVAAGWWHTLGLKGDGTVVAVGYNGHGQCNVGYWTDIQQIVAGSVYTVGLKTDGTVVAVGNNFYGQCNVGSWTDIQQVATGTKHTVALQTGGTVVAVGDNEYGQCNLSSWTNIQQVAAGSHHTVGLKEDGTVVAVGQNNYGQCDLDDWYLGSFSPTLTITTDKEVYHRGDSMSVSAKVINPCASVDDAVFGLFLVSFLDVSLLKKLSFNMPANWEYQDTVFSVDHLPNLRPMTYAFLGVLGSKRKGAFDYDLACWTFESCPCDEDAITLRQKAEEFVEGLTINSLTNMKAVSLDAIVPEPEETVLMQNLPNPFNPETWIPYQLKESSEVTVSIYDISGQLVRRLELGQQKAGFYVSKDKAAYWDGKNSFGEKVSSGLYFYTLQAGSYIDTKRMLILK